eukprot:7833895-Lingulodinium_polyedra.AAC.1
MQRGGRTLHRQGPSRCAATKQWTQPRGARIVALWLWRIVPCNCTRAVCVSLQRSAGRVAANPAR